MIINNVSEILFSDETIKTESHVLHAFTGNRIHDVKKNTTITAWQNYIEIPTL